jgi:hypothetical protein
MTRKKRAGGGKKATIVLANEADDLKGALKHLGGSRSDDWNNILANQAINTLWLKHSDEETRDQQYDATLFALIAIGPRDELEGHDRGSAAGRTQCRHGVLPASDAR